VVQFKCASKWSACLLLFSLSPVVPPICRFSPPCRSCSAGSMASILAAINRVKTTIHGTKIPLSPRGMSQAEHRRHRWQRGESCGNSVQSSHTSARLPLATSLTPPPSVCSACAGQKIMLWVYCGSPVVVGVPFMWWLVGREERTRVSAAAASAKQHTSSAWHRASTHPHRPTRMFDLPSLPLDCSSELEARWLHSPESADDSRGPGSAAQLAATQQTRQ